MTASPPASSLDLRPDPGAASTSRMLVAQTKLETTLTMRRGESVLLTLVIPLLLLVFFSSVDVLPL